MGLHDRIVDAKYDRLQSRLRERLNRSREDIGGSLRLLNEHVWANVYPSKASADVVRDFVEPELARVEDVGRSLLHSSDFYRAQFDWLERSWAQLSKHPGSVADCIPALPAEALRELAEREEAVWRKHHPEASRQD